MLKFNLLIALIASTFLTSCDQASIDRENQITNEQTLKGAGEYIGTLNNGKKLVRYRIVSDGLHDQYVYIIDSTQPVTVNEDVSSGKTTSNQVTTFLPPQSTANR